MKRMGLPPYRVFHVRWEDGSSQDEGIRREVAATVPSDFAAIMLAREAGRATVAQMHADRLRSYEATIAGLEATLAYWKGRAAEERELLKTLGPAKPRKFRGLSEYMNEFAWRWFERLR
jgi:hypothetical protein